MNYGWIMWGITGDPFRFRLQRVQAPEPLAKSIWKMPGENRKENSIGGKNSARL